MTEPTATACLGPLATDLTVLLTDCALKATVLLAGTAAIACAFRHQSAARRHLLWVSAIVSALLLPGAVLLLPGWHILPSWGAAGAVIAAAPMAPAVRPDNAVGKPTPGVLNDVSNRSASANPFAVPSSHNADAPAATTAIAPPAAADSQTAAEPLFTARSWSVWITTVWVIGMLFCGARVAVSSFTLWRIKQESRPLQKGPVFELHESIRRRLQIHQDVRLLISETYATPMAWGVLLPHIQLPKAAEHWSGRRLRAVLTHEMSHICRRDPLVQWLVQIAGFVYWFHPLMWLAKWRIRVERERACDDMVVKSGVSATEYAEHLLRITASLDRCRLAGVMSLAMTRPHRLEGRLLAILNQRTNRQGPTGTAILFAAGLAVCLALPVAMLQAEPHQDRATADRAEPTAIAKTESPVRLGYVDNTAEGRRSIAGSGHAVQFERPGSARYLMAVEMFASRYGHADPPAEDFHLYVLDEKHRLVHAIPFPYGMIERGTDRWYTLKINALKVPKRFTVALSFNPHSTKGIYLGLDKSVKRSHSLTGRPTQGYQPVPDRYDWMIRAVLVEQVPTASPFDDPSEN